jgi:hypothetical protein
VCAAEARLHLVSARDANNPQIPRAGQNQARIEIGQCTSIFLYYTSNHSRYVKLARSATSNDERVEESVNKNQKGDEYEIEASRQYCCRSFNYCLHGIRIERVCGRYG